MSGYTPVFSSVFDGTLHGRWPHTGIWVCLLAMADKHGCIDKVPRAIAADIGIDIDTLLACITDFCAPDEYSRSAESDGRRLELIDPARPWGWRIINHAKYREKARLDAQNARQVADGRNAEKVRRYKERQKEKDTAGHPRTPTNTLSNTNTNTNTNIPSLRSGVQGGKPPKRASKRCPEAFEIPSEAFEKIRSECPDVDLDFETRRFRDYEFATAKSDWLATWRNWMRKAQEGAAKSRAPRLTKYEESQKRLAAWQAKPHTTTNPLLEGPKP